MSGFPNIHDDEALISIIQKLVVWECAATRLKAAKQLFESATIQFCSPFPSCIPALAQVSTIAPKQFVLRHTTLPIYKTFTSDTKYFKAYENLICGDSDKVFKSLSLIANRQCNTGSMRYCPQCAREEIEEVGLPYWHVAHQLPGAFACDKHHLKLVTMSVTRKRFDNWPNAEVDNHSVATDVEIRLVKFARYFQYHSDEIRLQHPLPNIYRSKLSQMGFITVRGHVRIKQLRESLLSFYSEILDKREVKGVFDDARYPLYPSCILKLSGASISPVKHLLMMAFLFESVKELLYQDSVCDNCMNSVIPIAAQVKKDDANEIKSLLIAGYSLRQVATETEHSVGFVKKLAVQLGIDFDSRAQKLFAPERRKILTELMAGNATKTIAKHFDCSQGAVEQILSQHPEIVAQRRLERFQAKRIVMRTSLLKTLASFSHPRRQDVKTTNNKAYIWLYKHDREWLYIHLPNAIPREERLSSK